MRSGRRSIAVCLLWLAPTACRFIGGDAATHRLSQDELLHELTAFTTRFSAVVQDAADAIAARTQQPQVRVEAVRWKLACIEDSREALLQANPLHTFFDQWCLVVQHRAYFSGEPAQFGALRSLALEACRQLEDDIEGIGARLFGKEELSRVEDDIESFAADQPLGPGYSRRPYRPDRDRRAGAVDVGRLLAVPLAPYRALRGIDEGAEAIRDFSGVAQRFSTVVSDLPEVTRWQLELVLADLQTMDVVAQFSNDVTRVSESAARLVEAAETLPADVEGAAARALERVEAAQPELRLTLEQTRETAVALEATVARGEELLAGVEGASTRLEAAGTAWKGTIDAIAGLTEREQQEAADTADEHGFDVREYDAALARAAEAAVELRATIEELRALLQDEALEARLREVDASASATLARGADLSKDVVDHAFVRGLMLVGAALVAAVIFVALRALVAGRIGAAGDRTDPHASG